MTIGGTLSYDGKEAEVIHQELVADYWLTVIQLLTSPPNGFTSEQAGRGVEDYRRFLGTHQIGDLVYHKDPEQTADTVAAVIRNMSGTGYAVP